MICLIVYSGMETFWGITIAQGDIQRKVHIAGYPLFFKYPDYGDLHCGFARVQSHRHWVFSGNLVYLKGFVIILCTTALCLDFLNLTSFGIASRPPSATTCFGEGGPEADRGLKIHFEYFCIFVDKASSYFRANSAR
jgi:hypothetical protein